MGLRIYEDQLTAALADVEHYERLAEFWKGLHAVSVESRHELRRQLDEAKQEIGKLTSELASSELSGPFGEALLELYDYQVGLIPSDSPLLPFAHAAALAYFHARQAERGEPDPIDEEDCNEACCDEIV